RRELWALPPERCATLPGMGAPTEHSISLFPPATHDDRLALSGIPTKARRSRSPKETCKAQNASPQQQRKRQPGDQASGKEPLALIRRASIRTVDEHVRGRKPRKRNLKAGVHSPNPSFASTPCRSYMSLDAPGEDMPAPRG